mmetsp:Transcript_6546/g.21193  ORF Transcript_6546/g.21193 Transcript_6546/m.21193 type:complete len:88 (-) Transcript_6546:100-363(-)
MGVPSVYIMNVHAVATWTWGIEDEDCGICRMSFDSHCPDCVQPGDDCVPAWGVCGHTFHMHCICKWIAKAADDPRCPMCRQEWEFRA